MRIAAELRGALHNANIQGPYILVGNAFGGDNARTFAARYPTEVAGLVLVEADIVSSPEERRGHAKLIASNARMPRRDRRRQTSASTACSSRWRRPQLRAGFLLPGIAGSDVVAGINAKLLELVQTKVALYDSYISEMEQMPADETYLEQHSRSLGSRPIRVLTTGNHGVHSLDSARPPDPEQRKYRTRSRASRPSGSSSPRTPGSCSRTRARSTSRRPAKFRRRRNP